MTITTDCYSPDSRQNSAIISKKLIILGVIRKVKRQFQNHHVLASLKNMSLRGRNIILQKDHSKEEGYYSGKDQDLQRKLVVSFVEKKVIMQILVEKRRIKNR